MSHEVAGGLDTAVLQEWGGGRESRGEWENRAGPGEQRDGGLVRGGGRL